MTRKKIKIGNLELNGFVYIPPMAGVTNIAFRKVVRYFDKDTLIATEMVSSKALSFRSQDRMKLSNDEHPVGVQIFGHEPELMALAAIKAEEEGADFVDVNMGCPVPKITKGKDGAALMREPDLACEIVKSILKAVKIPLTVKIRLGWDKCSLNSPELAKRFEDLGVSALTVHGRTREQKYTGKADWELIGEVKKSVAIPIFGNGDVKSPEDAKKLMDISGCDGVAVARACIGSPWLTKQINDYLKTGSYENTPPLDGKIEIAKIHLEELIKLKGEVTGIRESKRHLMNYFSGIKDASKVREKICMLNTKAELWDLFDSFRAYTNPNFECREMFA